MTRKPIDGEATRLRELAMDLLQRAVEPDPEKARELLAAATDLGDLEATYQLSLLLLDGVGGPQEAERGLQLLEGAAEAGNVDAALALGRLATDLTGDDVIGVYWLSRASAGGSTLAMRLLARALVGGRGVPEADPAEALRLLLSACQGGDAAAALDLLVLSARVDAGRTFFEWFGPRCDQEQLPPSLLRGLGALIAELEPEWFFDAAIAVASQGDPGRAALFDAAREAAPDWFATNGDDLKLALGVS